MVELFNEAEKLQNICEENNWESCFIGGLPFEENLLKRANYQQFLSEISLEIITAEDLIVMRSFAERPKDWLNVESIIIRQDSFDWNYILEQLEPLAEAKYAPEILFKLANLRDKFYQK